MHGNLPRVMPYVWEEEGAYADHPHDPGGATNLGITRATLAAWRGRPVTKDEVKALTKAEATKIYERNYAKPVRFDDLPSGVDYAVLDFAINSGPGRAIKYLQRVANAAEDGIVGPETLHAIKRYGAVPIINGLCDARLGFLRGLGTWGTFGKGWTKRVERVRRRALQMADVPAPIPDVPPVEPKEPVKPGRGGAVGAGAFIGAFVVAVLTFVAKALGWL